MFSRWFVDSARRERWQRRRRFALRHAVLAGIDFRSGLGDSSHVLYGLVRAMKPDVCVEIGSARGLSACHVALGLEENERGTLYAIDPHIRTGWNDENSVDTLAILRANLRSISVEHRVEIVQELSSRAADGWQQPIDILFIDGDHSYEGVKRDWDLFTPHVREFGVVVFHDTIWDRQEPNKYSRADMGVPRFVDEIRASGMPVITLERDCGVSLVQVTRGGVPLSAVV